MKTISYRRSFRCLIIFAILSVLFQGSSKIVLASTPSSVPNLDIVLVMDESWPMWAKSDPPNDLNQGWRVVMAKLFADILGIDQSNASHRLSVILYGNDAILGQPFTDVQDTFDRSNFKENLDSIHATTHWDKNYYYTNIPAALSLAYNELDTNGRENAQKVIIILSDGTCELPSATDQAQCNQKMRQIVKDHSNNQYPIYTIAFTSKAPSAGDSTIYANLWQEIAAQTGGEYYQPNKADSDLLAVYYQIVHSLINLPAQSPSTQAIAPSKQPFTVPPNQMQIVFTIVKNNNKMTESIIRPNGIPVKTTDPDVKASSSSLTDSCSIKNPDPGTWYVELNGNGQATIQFITFPLESLRVIHQTPSGIVFPAGKPMDISVQIVNAMGDLQTIPGLTVNITFPDGTATTLPLTKSNSITYSALLENTTQTGHYALHFMANGVDDLQNIEVINALWIKIIEPVPGMEYPVNNPLRVRAQMMMGLNPATMADLNNKSISVLAQLLDLDKKSIDMLQLNAEGNGIFSKDMNIAVQGNYELIVTMDLTNPSGEEFKDIATTSVKAGNIPVATPTGIPPTIISTSTVIPSHVSSSPNLPSFIAFLGWISGFLILIGLGGYGLLWFNKPSLIGTLDAGGMQAPIPLSGKGSVFFGSDPHCAIIIQGEGILPKHAELHPVGKRNNPKVEIRSINSSKPIIINGIETLSQTLRNEDKIRIGNSDYTYNGPPEPEDFELDSTSADLFPSASNDDSDLKF